MFDIVTIGAATRDVFLISKEFKFIQSSQFETGIGECVALGSKIEMEKIVHTTGGGATNAAVTFARLGFKTAAICKVGDDGVGRDLILDLQREGVTTTLVKRVARGETAYSTLLTATSGERTVLVYRGVSANFSAADIPWKECAGKWFYVTSLGGNIPLMKRIVSNSVKCGGFVAWNPGSKEIQAGLTAIRPLLMHVRVVSLNREEAERLTRKTTFPEMFRALATPGNVVLITDGPNGAYAHLDGTTVFTKGHGIKSVSRTGAGDAFGSGFVAGYIKHGQLKDALAVATLNAESVIQHIGAKAGILKKWPTAAALQSLTIRRI